MPCSSCGQRRQVVTESQAQAIASGDNQPKAVYYVTTPNGDRTEFTDYIEAVTFRRQNNGVLTTTTA